MGALAGVKVIEIAGMGPTPFCGMLLGDMGADVLRIDRPAPVERGIGVDDRSDLRGRNKRSAIIDLKRPEGRDALLKLVARADILIEGFRPGVMERMGLGPAECHAANRRLVYGRATGWGQDGPLARTAGHDINYIALSGALSMIGPREGPPLPPLNLVGDYGGGALYLAFGLVCALLSSRATGQGQVVDAAMIDGVSSLLTVFHGLRQAGCLREERGANPLDGGAPFYATYQTSDGGWMAVGALEERFYTELLKGLGLRRDETPDRAERSRWPELRNLLARRFLEKSRDEWTTIFATGDACVSPVLSLSEAGGHPHNAARRTLHDVNGIAHPAPAPRLSHTPGAIRRAPARSGAHTADALRDWGFADAEITSGLGAGYLAAAPDQAE
ncbi:MAG: CoA transferase [Methylobacteriaceae bacterium]|nr:CoA transferase [Methylobacteriaceae bacterium]